MADKEVCQRELLLKVFEEIDHLGLDGDIQGGDRLIANNEARIERERPGDPNALALAARKFVRIAVGEPRIETDG